MSFVEKKSYNPHVNIEYVDDNGRALTPKEVRIIATCTYLFSVFFIDVYIW